MMSMFSRSENKVLALSFTGFTMAFAVWMMYGVMGIPIRGEFGLSDAQLAWLLAASALAGALPRGPIGLLTDKYGGRVVFTALLLIVVPGAFLLSYAQTYEQLVGLALWTGLTGNTFVVGIAWNSAWFPKERQGVALGFFGAGNVGASVTKLIAPPVIAFIPAGYIAGVVPSGWRFIPMLYAVMLVIMTLVLWTRAPTPDRKPAATRSFVEMHRPLRAMNAWRFSYYYNAVFGAYVALSLWLPKYYTDTFGVGLTTAALLTASFIFPASLLRPVGGWLSDRWGARRATNTFLLVMIATGIVVAIPGLIKSPYLFAGIVFIFGCGMGAGKASVYRYVYDFFPRDVGVVGGLVGQIGAFGGFILPPIWAYTLAATGIPETTWLVLLAIAVSCYAWQLIASRAERRSEAQGRLFAGSRKVSLKVEA
ncbi:MAG: NarK/NasA family nitrate transporter [Chloroflexi bacterium]|nr:NarK/NasA family nitrate transporter [Chloroflexota bacterium]